MSYTVETEASFATLSEWSTALSERSTVAFGMLYPDRTISDIECFPDEITPEEYREIIKWQALAGIISEEEADEILAWMDRNIVPSTDGGGSEVSARPAPAAKGDNAETPQTSWAQEPIDDRSFRWAERR